MIFQMIHAFTETSLSKYLFVIVVCCVHFSFAIRRSARAILVSAPAMQIVLSRL